MALTISVQKLAENAVLPEHAHAHDAGADLFYCGKDKLLAPGDTDTFETGIAIAIPEGYVGLIWPRSGLSVRYAIDVFAGVIDAGYRGEIKVVLHNAGHSNVYFKSGDKIAQLLVQPVEECQFVISNSLNDTERGKNGFGSTDNVSI